MANYQPANRCIYCDTTGVELSDEHVLPYSLGGSYVLPKASCRAHATMTSQIEQRVARDIYGTLRAQEGVQTRRRSLQRALLATPIEVTGVDLRGRPARAKVRSTELPRLDLVLMLPPPGILLGRDPMQDSKSAISIDVSDPVSDRILLRKLKWRSLDIRSPGMRPNDVIRLLAKIAHGFACAELGSNAFQPLLLPLILGEEVAGSHFVGGFEPQLPQLDEALKLREVSLGATRFVAVDISLHFFAKTPRYQVVCGRIEA